MRISAQLFEVYLHCPTKCWLKSVGEHGTGNEYSEWVQAQNEAYRAAGVERLRSVSSEGEFAVSPPADSIKEGRWRLGLNVLAQTEKLESEVHIVERVPSKGRGRAAQFIPLRFISRNKLCKDDKLLLAFDSMVLLEVLGRDVSVGRIIHGDGHTTLKVKTSALVGQVRKMADKIVPLLSSTSPPDLVLNRHCPECEFRNRCRQKAVEKDDLSLLAGMTEKERKRHHSKGIFTVTQLSFTYRPRRRPKRFRKRRDKYHHSLKALAIREKKTHIIGIPELKISGTPIYLDVEQLPDRGFYYLIGLRTQQGDSPVQHSLWADGPGDEKQIWNQLLEILGSIEHPVLIHYGGFEKAFLRHMCERYGKPPENSAAATAIESSVNLLSAIFARIYFPSFSNKLKDIASLIGVKWHTAEPSGLLTIVWRHQWETGKAPEVKHNLILYNQDDCAALELLTKEVLDLISHSRSRADVDLADEPTMPQTERASQIHADFKRVLRSAYSDYWQSRIKIREEATSDPAAPAKQATRCLPKQRRLPRVKGRIIHVPRKRKCQRHPDQPTMLRPQIKLAEHAILDLAFTKTGFKQTVVRYTGKTARCSHCNSTFPPPGVKRVRHQVHGTGVHAWVVYLRMMLRLSFRLIVRAAKDMLDLELTPTAVQGMVERWAKRCTQTEERILAKMLQSPAIHADETQISISGKQQYVWTLTDGEHTIFRLTEGRETDFLPGLLGKYKGILVSDFYGGYDALPYRQQKCLVHLIGDLNDDLWSHPFDSQYEEFVASVRDLLLPILADAQRFGLKAYHLRKHQPSVERFYRDVIDVESPPEHELILKYQKRFQRFRESLFLFADADGVPWNNNAAERALRHVAVQRKISGAFTSRGASDYLRLLGIAQTCRFQGKSFLSFLLFGCVEIDEFHDRSRRCSPEAFEFDDD